MSNFFSFSSLFSGLSFKVFFKLYPRKSSVQKQSMEVFCKKGFLKNFARFTPVLEAFRIFKTDLADFIIWYLHACFRKFKSFRLEEF